MGSSIPFGVGDLFDRSPDLKSSSPLYGYLRMWNLLRLGDKTLAARPQPVLVRHRTAQGVEYLEDDGFAWGWHRDGRWETDGEHEADTEKFDRMLNELVSSGAHLIPSRQHAT